MKRKSGYFWSLWKNNPKSRVYFMLLFVIPMPLLILSVSIFYRLPRVNDATEEINNSMQIRYEVEREEIATSGKKMKIAMDSWEGVRKELPDSYEAVSKLIIDLSSFMSSMGFEMSYSLGVLDPDIDGVKGLSLLPINLKLKVKGIGPNQNGSANVGLEHFVEMLHGLVTGYHGIDLSNVVVNGLGEGIRTMEVSINLWVGFGSESHSVDEV